MLSLAGADQGLLAPESELRLGRFGTQQGGEAQRLLKWNSQAGQAPQLPQTPILTHKKERSPTYFALQAPDRGCAAVGVGRPTPPTHLAPLLLLEPDKGRNGGGGSSSVSSPLPFSL